MTAVFVVLALAALGAVGVLATGRVGQLPSAPVDVRPARLDSQPPFDIALRGYRMDQVDEALAALQAQLTERDAEIDRLRSS